MSDYPDDNPKTIYGVAKPSMDVVPTVPLVHLMLAFQHGAAKYGPFNWREKTVSASIYYSAALRHLMAYWDGEDYDPESGVHHLGLAMACMSIVLDATRAGKFNDNRPPKGGFAELVRELTKSAPGVNPVVKVPPDPEELRELLRTPGAILSQEFLPTTFGPVDPNSMVTTGSLLVADNKPYEAPIPDTTPVSALQRLREIQAAQKAAEEPVQ